MYVCAAGLASSYGAELRSVAVLSPYKAQVALLQRRFRARAPLLDRVEFGTVDGFQVTHGRARRTALYTACACRLCRVLSSSPDVGHTTAEEQPKEGVFASCSICSRHSSTVCFSRRVCSRQSHC